MGSANPSNPSAITSFQYAVPVTIESFGKGFVAHYFWAPRYWIPQLKTFRWALYTVQNRYSPSRRLVRRLPAEIMSIIVEHVKEAAVEQGFRDCEQRMGALNSSVSLEIEEGLARIKNQGKSNKDFMGNSMEDTLTKFMMKYFSLAIMPGMGSGGQLMTHLFLCFTHFSESLHSIEFDDWVPAEHPYPTLSDEKTISAPSTARTLITRSGGLWKTLAISKIYVLDPDFVAQALESKSNIGKAVRDMRLEVVALAQVP